MKIIWNKDNFTLFIFTKYDDVSFNKYIKDILLKINRRFNKKISGFYNVTVYKNDIVGLILDFEKEDNFDFFSDIVDLNITFSNNNTIYLEFDNPCLIDNADNIYISHDKYYLDITNITKKDFFKFIEFSKIKYGKDAIKLVKNIKTLRV